MMVYFLNRLFFLTTFFALLNHSCFGAKESSLPPASPREASVLKIQSPRGVRNITNSLSNIRPDEDSQSSCTSPRLVSFTESSQDFLSLIDKAKITLICYLATLKKSKEFKTSSQDLQKILKAKQKFILTSFCKEEEKLKGFRTRKLEKFNKVISKIFEKLDELYQTNSNELYQLKFNESIINLKAILNYLAISNSTIAHTFSVIEYRLEDKVGSIFIPQ